MSSNLIRSPYPSAAGGAAAGLALWLKGDGITGLSNGDQINTWPDSSGNGRDAAGVVGNVLKPTWRSTDGPDSMPCVRLFSNATDEGGYFTLPNFLTTFPAGHGWVLYKLDILPTIISKCAPPLGDFGSDTTGDLFPWPTDGKIYHAFGSTARKSTAAAPASFTDWGLFEWRSGAAHWSIHENGTQLFSTGVNTVGWSTVPKVGATQTNSNRLFGLIAEIRLFNKIQVAGEIVTEKAYWSGKYPSLPIV